MEKKGTIGIDIGSSAARIIQVDSASEKVNPRNHRPKLAAIGSVEFPHRFTLDNLGPTEADQKRNKKWLSSLIQRLITASGATARDAVVTIPSHRSVTGTLKVPDLKPKQINATISIESQRRLGLPEKQIVFDYKVVRESPKPANFVEALYAAAPEHIVADLIDIFNIVDVNLLSVETEPFAMIRATGLAPLRLNEPKLVIDFGNATTTLVLFYRGLPFYAGNIQVGGRDITTYIQDNMGVDQAGAEQFKRDVESRLMIEFMSDMPVLVTLIEKIRDALSLSLDEAARPVSEIILLGGGSRTSGFKKLLEEYVKTPVRIHDIWNEVAVPDGAEKKLRELDTNYDIALGSALKKR